MIPSWIHMEDFMEDKKIQKGPEKKKKQIDLYRVFPIED